METSSEPAFVDFLSHKYRQHSEIVTLMIDLKLVVSSMQFFLLIFSHRKQ